MDYYHRNHKPRSSHWRHTEEANKPTQELLTSIYGEPALAAVNTNFTEVRPDDIDLFLIPVWQTGDADRLSHITISSDGDGIEYLYDHEFIIIGDKPDDWD
jgi:hypothetical protein